MADDDVLESQNIEEEEHIEQVQPEEEGEISSSPNENNSITDNENISVEESLIEILKKSLKLIENEFLESGTKCIFVIFNPLIFLFLFFLFLLLFSLEIDDLKELFTVQIDDFDRIEEGKLFWLQVDLPVFFRFDDSITEDKRKIGFKIKQKDDDEEVDGGNELSYEILEFKIDESTEKVDTAVPCDDETFKTILTDLITDKSKPLLSVIEDFYIRMEEHNHPHKEIVRRDFYYPVFDCRHWGRSNLTTSSDGGSGHGRNSSRSDSGTNLSYRARALYDFQALMQGELSFAENDILIVLANLGNGWLTARRDESSSTTTTHANNLFTDDSTGLIPENYIERV
jgi:hypothetical protein